MNQGYFDYNATTPLSHEVKNVMYNHFETFGNPSSLHQAGREASKKVTLARKQVARLVGCDSTRLIFTSGGTESNNLAIKGKLHSFINRPGHIITSSIEHPSVLEVCQYMQHTFGFRITYLNVNENGQISIDELKRSITPDTQMITVMLANNEIGSIQPIRDIVDIARPYQIYVHCDAVQAIGKLEVDVTDLNVDSLSVSAHKFYGPKGAGALYVKDPSQLHTMIHGGGQEKKLRSGTENVLSIIGMGEASAYAYEHLEEDMQHCKRLRALMLSLMQDTIQDYHINGGHHADSSSFLPNTLNIGFTHVDGQELAEMLSRDFQVSVSVGSACSNSKHQHKSHVLKAIGLSDEQIDSSIRVSFGRYTNEEDVRFFVQSLKTCLEKLRMFVI